jgi:hypothetical protein
VIVQLEVAMRSFALAIIGLLAAGVASAGPSDTRSLQFPKTLSGAVPLSVDLHTHSVFSDGHVWPSVRVWEARKDSLFAMAVTEHLEYQPHKQDIPHPDRNRSFQVAKEALKGKDVAGEGPLLINGAEITRSMPPGHVNAVFVSDANKLLVADPEAAIKSANDQGAFVFWNHPYWTAQRPNGVAQLTDMHRKLIKARQLHGIEVVNGMDYSTEAFQIALDNNLVVIGTSDIHGLIDYDYDIAKGEHRTTTLVLAKDASEASLREALNAGRTVAYFKHTLIGREANVRDIVAGALKLTTGEYVEKSTVLHIELANAAPTPLTLRLVGGGAFYDATSLVTVPARASLKLQLKDVADASKVRLEFEVLNALVGPNKPLAIVLTASGR